ncbi:amidohydrolase [Thalassobius sp. Cn5-15]|nr:amidohydrolase [Thalassobius sp. Cn5-15]MCG7494451.1 amidohydrolase [Thalassobius sp. Cn5-15]
MSPEQIATLTDVRHALHRRPEVSGQEVETAAHIVERLRDLDADQIWQDLGGHGVAAAFDGAAPGPTVMIRCELDGLPIPEQSDLQYRSEIADNSHTCGHDGHMSMVIGVAMALCDKRPQRGRVVVLFQPAEETGQGAPAVVADPRWVELRPDYAFAIHNLPGLALGAVQLCDGVACCASRGMQVRLTGKSSHAAAPEDGVSPAAAMATLMTSLPALSSGGALQAGFKLATLTHAQLGEATFGIAPGVGELRCTLRAVTDADMADLIERAEAEVRAIAARHSLEVNISWHDVFSATVNSAAANVEVMRATKRQSIPLRAAAGPQRFSEDFACYGLDGVETAMIFLGSGVDQPQLHNPDFDFPDTLLPVGTELFLVLINQLLGWAEDA